MTTTALRVFISYSHRDRARAVEVEHALVSLGHQPFRDERMTSGMDFPTRLENEIRTADVVLVLWTRHSVESHWIREEANLAKQLNKLRPVSLQASPPFGFETVHTPNLRLTSTGHDVVTAAGLGRLAMQTTAQPPPPIERPTFDDWWGGGRKSLLRRWFGL